MSVKLSFKPIFIIDYDQELLKTVGEQVDKYSNLLENAIESQNSKIPEAIRESLVYLFETGGFLKILPRFFMGLYFLERSFVKATFSCIIDLFPDSVKSTDVSKIQELIEIWPKDKIPLLNMYKINKGTEDQFIIQLSDICIRWIDSYIPITKKHEFKLFEDSFHKNFIISNEDALITEIGLAAKNKNLILDSTQSFRSLATKVLSNLEEKKFSILIANPGSLECTSFLYYIGKEVLKLGKRILLNEIDFFKLPFVEYLDQANLVFINTIIGFQNPQEQIELLNSLRNTPSIVLLSIESWSRFEQMKIFSHEIESFNIKQKDLTLVDEKEYIKSFITNYLSKSNVKLDLFQKNDLIEVLVKKSEGSINYIDLFMSNIQKISNLDAGDKSIDNLPQGYLELTSILFKKIFIDIPKAKLSVLTLFGLAQIQQKFGLWRFSKTQILTFKNIILREFHEENLEEDQDYDVFNFLTKISGNFYCIEQSWLGAILKDPIVFFNDEKTDDIKLKKLLLTLQNYITSLTSIDYETLFRKTLLTAIEQNSDHLLDLRDIIIISPDFDDLLKTRNYSPTKLKEILVNVNDSDSEHLKKSYYDSQNYFFYTLEMLFDRYLVSGQYDTSQKIIDYFMAGYEMFDDEHKIRAHFQTARQLITRGKLESAYQELEKTILLFRRTKSYLLSGIVLRLLGEIYFINRQPVFGSYAFDQILQMYSRILPVSSRFKAFTLSKLSDRLNEVGLFANALQSLEESVNIFRSNALLLEELNASQKMADILYKLGSPNIAIHELDTAISKIGDLDLNYSKQLESIKQAFENPELFNPLYSYKNWLKINYSTVESLQLQEEKYEKIFEENREKNISEDLLQQYIYFIRILFKLGRIRKLKSVMDSIERDIPTKLQNRGLLFLELSLLHNFMGNIDIGNYYSDLARNSLYTLPIDFEISSLHQLNYIGYQLYLSNYEYAELLIKDHFLRKKRKNEHILYLFYAFLETKKSSESKFDTFFEKGNAIFLEKSDFSYTKNEIKQYAPCLLFNQYERIFPISHLPKNELNLINLIFLNFYKVTFDATKGFFTEALESLGKIIEIASGLSSEEWKRDIQLNYYKRMGQLHFNDKSNVNNPKKSIQYWQEALRIISFINKEHSQAYFFEKLDLLYLIGKNSIKFSLLGLDDANKYLISGKNLLTRYNIKNSLRLEFQFDAALGINYFEFKDYEKAEKYFSRALEKHENKLYLELEIILRDLLTIYKENQDEGKIKNLIEKYGEIINVFNIKVE